MRTNRLFAGVFLLVVLASPALAQNLAGVYEVKFEEMSTNCSPPPA